MNINPVKHPTLAQVVASQLAASILDGELKAGDKLPSERELMKQLSVSRATLREALKALSENRLIEARKGVGSFVLALDRNNYVQAAELALVAHASSRLKIHLYRRPQRNLRKPHRVPNRCASAPARRSPCASPTCGAIGWEPST